MVAAPNSHPPAPRSVELAALPLTMHTIPSYEGVCFPFWPMGLTIFSLAGARSVWVVRPKPIVVFVRIVMRGWYGLSHRGVTGAAAPLMRVGEPQPTAAIV